MDASNTSLPWPAGEAVDVRLTGAQFIALYVPLSAVTLSALAANITVILVVFTQRKFHTSGYGLLASLSLVEACAGAFLWLSATTSLLYLYGAARGMPEAYLVALGRIYRLVGFAQMAHLLCIAVNRYCSVLAYRSYQVMFGKLRTGVMVAACWLYGIVWSALVSIRYDPVQMRGRPDKTLINLKLDSIASGLAVLTVLAVAYLYVHMTCRLRSNKVDPRNATTSERAMSQREKYKRIREETNLTIQFSLVSLVYAVTVTFTIIAWFIKVPYLQKPLNICFIALWNVNFAINPFIYMIFNRSLRNACLRKWCGNLLEKHGHGITSTANTASTTEFSARSKRSPTNNVKLITVKSVV